MLRWLCERRSTHMCPSVYWPSLHEATTPAVQSWSACPPWTKPATGGAEVLPALPAARNGGATRPHRLSSSSWPHRQCTPPYLRIVWAERFSPKRMASRMAHYHVIHSIESAAPRRPPRRWNHWCLAAVSQTRRWAGLVPTTLRVRRSWSQHCMDCILDEW